jgi:antitoxin YefM
MDSGGGARPPFGSMEQRRNLGAGARRHCCRSSVAAVRRECRNRQDAAEPGKSPARAVYRLVYSRQMGKTVAVRELRSNLSKLLSDVADRRDHVLVTRNGRPAAVLVPIDEYDALEETAEVLSDPDALAALEAGLGELERGETITLDDLRRELVARRALG